MRETYTSSGVLKAEYDDDKGGIAFERHHRSQRQQILRVMLFLL